MESNRRTFLSGLGAAALAAGIPESAARPNRIDVHHHVYPPEYLKVQRAGIIASSDADPTTFFTWTPARALDAMDQSGVSIAFSSPPLPGVWIAGNAGQSRRVVRIYNDGAAEIARQYPARFGLFAALALPDVEGSLREIDYAFSTLKTDGISLLSSYANKYLGEPAFDPVFAELNRRKTIVYVHPTTPACCNHLQPGIATSTTEFLFDTTRTIMSLLYAGTFYKYPDVKFIFAHTGGTMTDLAYRMTAYAVRHKEIAERIPDGTLAELKKLYYDVANSTNPSTMAALMNLVPTTQILFGSDYPYVQIPVTTTGMDRLNLSPQVAAAINRENALAILPRLRSAQ
jgi:predicted TIM-barrel fold metal-dependent hydrolase